mmetsp:Transcript_36683/g.48323  ORF Transcript_36683/g.48323 Transcript_36683/m.48323 type:complete len:391 (-) Transcript_36683:364-1536(-)
MKISVLSLLPTLGLGFVTLPSYNGGLQVSSPNMLTMAAATQPMTKFDRMKAKWKGQTNTIVQEEGISYDDFENLLGEQRLSFQRDEVVTGTVVQFEHQSALVDIGGKASAYLPLREMSLTPIEKEQMEEILSIDSEYEFKIISGENENGQVTVSLKRLQFEQAWERVQAMQLEDAVFSAEVISTNRGGAIVALEGLRAFLPGSHLVGGIPNEELIGETLKLKFLEVNPETGKLVVSNRRAILEEEMKELSRGDVVDGVVKAIKPYGAFIDIFGMSGLLHISQISYDRIDDLEALLNPGMKIKCMIIDHDKVNGRIALSTKTLEPEPGDMIKDPSKVYENAEETAAKYHERMEAERKAREEAAKSIVMGLGEGLENMDSDVLSGITDDIDA